MTDPLPPCPTCGYPLPEAPCQLCEGTIRSVDGLGTVQPGRRFFLIEIVEGFLSLFQACLLLMTKKEYMGTLKVAVVANFCLVMLFAGGMFWGFWELFDTLLAVEEGEAESWWQSARSWGGGLMALPCAVLSTWAISLVLIEAGMAPFLDPLANATERMLAGDGMRPVELGMWRGLMAGLNAAAQVLVLQIIICAPILLLALIPVIGLPFLILGALVSAYLNAIVWFEIPAIRRGYGIRERKRIIRRNWGRALGFGLACQLGVFVPMLNVLFLGPAAAVAVSLLYLRFDKQP